MAEQLSQNQIDSLLKRLTTGQPASAEEDIKVNGKVVKEYDFKSPKKFTKEQLKLLEDLYETFSRILSTYFSGILRLYCEVSVLQIEEQRYFEFSNALPDNALIAMVDIRPEEKRYEELSVIMDVSTQIGYFMIDRMLGGLGQGNNFDRVFSDLELAILRSMFEQTAAHMQGAWNNYVEVEAVLSGLETNARMLQSLAPNEIVVIIILNIKAGDITGNINLCIPATGLGDLINNFNSKYQKSSRRKLPEEEDVKKKMFENIIGSNLEVKAVLDNLTLDVQDIMQLQVDDIIPLNKAIDSDVCVMVDDIPWFDGRLGEFRQKKAIKLSHLIAQNVNIEKRDSYGEG
ncbi:MAG: flagellar motor switch protein FliM [Oscillospiraceae bacterium]